MKYKDFFVSKKLLIVGGMVLVLFIGIGIGRISKQILYSNILENVRIWYNGENGESELPVGDTKIKYENICFY